MPEKGTVLSNSVSAIQGTSSVQAQGVLGFPRRRPARRRPGRAWVRTTSGVLGFARRPPDRVAAWNGSEQGARIRSRRGRGYLDSPGPPKSRVIRYPAPVCRFAYLAIAFRDGPPPGAEDAVRTLAAASRVRAAILRPPPDSELARFAAGCAVIATPSEHPCACGWGLLELAPTFALARTLLTARDVLRVRIGLWWIRDGVDEANRHRIDPPLTLREIDAPELERIDWRKDHQLSVRRVGPPWPTETLARVASTAPTPAPARRRRR